MESKYRVLRLVATIWKILAWIVLVLFVLGACGTLASSFLGGSNPAFGNSNLGALNLVLGLVGAVVVLLLGAIYFLSLYAFAEIIDVLISLEVNTRSTAEQLKNLAKPAGTT